MNMWNIIYSQNIRILLIIIGLSLFSGHGAR